MDYPQVDLRALTDLLKPNKEDSDSEDENPKNTMSSMGPGGVGPSKDKISGNKLKGKLSTVKQDSKDIWHEEEIYQGLEFNDSDDQRPEPKYEVLYKQAVTAEDMFLGMANKTNATASCESMIVKISLPSTNVTDIDLDLKERFLDCRTSKYKLGLFLPHSNLPSASKAAWNSEDHTLTVTLKLDREYDEFNF